MSKCVVCKTEDALWAAQYVAEETPTFTLLGSHYRGFKVYKVCDACKNKWQALVENNPWVVDVLAAIRNNHI